MTCKNIIYAASILSLVLADPLPKSFIKARRGLPLAPGAPAISSSAPFPISSVAGVGAPAPSGTVPVGTTPIPTGISAPVPTTTGNSGGNGTSTGGSGSGSDTYKCYSGDGSPSAGWPAKSSWVSFESMFSANTPLMKTSCSQFPNAPPDTDQEIADIKSAITSASSSTGVDKEFILAIIMQESKGCVRVPTTNYGVRNPGLMQDHDGKASCNDGGVKTPCPAQEINDMIMEGTGGTSGGDGLKQVLKGGKDAQAAYKAARMYNSGSIDASGDLGKGIATHCYASDVANRLTGWVQAPSQCKLDGNSG